MADGKVRIETELDQAGFKSGLQKLANSVKSQSAALQKSLSDIGKNVKLKFDISEYSKGVKSVSEYNKALKSELNNVNSEVAKLSTQYRESVTQTGKYSEESEKLAEKLDDLKKKQSDLREEISKSSSYMEKYAFDFGKVGSAIKTGIGTAAKTVAVGVAATATGVATLSGLSISAYSDYEQLVGGVETLFGAGGQSLEEYAESVGKSVADVSDEYNTLMQSQQTVIENAKNAYQTAGLSANDYMETVTSFSASLLQSLGGDTVEAAKYADRAIVDMSDNANKMGTDMTLIQNAYQGFAKQNYTMLDNLKLGYGGTKEEMQRLIADSAKMTDIQEELGVTVDSSSLSFANIVNAISVMQKSLGIAGTTSKEAATTIQGSVNSMKGAWENLLVALSSDDMDVKEYVNKFVDSVIVVGKNVIPRIKEVLPSIASAISEMVDELGPYVSDTIKDLLPALISGAVDIAVNLAEKIPEIFATVADAIIQVFSNALESAPQETQDKLNGLKSIFEALLPVITGITAAIIAFRTAMTIGALIETVTKAMNTFKAANDAATISQAALNAVMNLNPFVLVATLIAGLVAAIITLWNTNEGFRNACISAWEAIKSGISSAIEAIKTAINSVIDFFKNLGSTIEQTFNEILQKCVSFGSNIVNSIKNGISSAWNGLVSWFNGIWDSVFGNKTANVTVNRSVKDVDGSHANGLSYVPFDGYIAELHQGEMVLTKLQAENIRKIMRSGFSRMGTANPTISTRGTTSNVTNQNFYIYGDVTDPDVMARRIRQEQRYGLAGAKV